MSVRSSELQMVGILHFSLTSLGIKGFYVGILTNHETVKLTYVNNNYFGVEVLQKVLQC